MNARDRTEIIDAIVTFTQPVLAEVRAYRAEVAAFRAEAHANANRMEQKFAEHDRDIAALMHRLFPDDDTN